MLHSFPQPLDLSDKHQHNSASVTNLPVGPVILLTLKFYSGLIVRSDDIFKSTIHRAINRSGVRRYSIPLFFGTDYDIRLEVRSYL